MTKNFLYVELFFGDGHVHVVYLPEDLCMPKCLSAAAAAAGALFACCPNKYRCRQFFNPNIRQNG